MIARVVAASLWIGIGAVIAFAPPAGAAEPVRELHGSADAFAAPGIALAWAVLRGSDEAATVVVIRIAADPARYASIAATAIDPFTQQRRPMLTTKATPAAVDLLVPRAQIAVFPRTEFRFHAAGGDSATPDVVVFYAGVPDTAPEFRSHPELDAYLAARIARVSADSAGK